MDRQESYDDDDNDLETNKKCDLSLIHWAVKHNNRQLLER